MTVGLGSVVYGDYVLSPRPAPRVEVPRSVAEFDDPVPASLHEGAGDVLLERLLVRLHLMPLPPFASTRFNDPRDHSSCLTTPVPFSDRPPRSTLR